MECSFRNLLITWLLLLQHLVQVDSNNTTRPVTILGNQTRILEVNDTLDLTLDLYCISNINSSASGIRWTFKGQDLNPRVNGSLSIVTINMLFSQSGEYSCGFPDDGKELWENVSITFGRKPPAVRNLTCVHNVVYERYFKCSWLPGALDTNLPTDYFFECGLYRTLNESGFYDSHHDKTTTTDFYKYNIKYKGKMAIAVTAQNDLGSSSMVKDVFSVELFPPMNVSGTFTDDNTLSVNWVLPPNNFGNDYHIMYREVFPILTTDWTKIEDVNIYQRPYGISNIRTGYGEYELKVGINHDFENTVEWSDPVKIVKNESNPTGKVDGKCLWDDDYTNIICNWNQLPKDKHNGRLLGYVVSVFSDNDAKLKEATVKHNDSLKVEFKDLPTDKHYTVNITAYNTAGDTTILSTFVARKPTSGIADGYIVVIVCASILLLVLLLLLLVRWIKKANFLTPFGEPKFFYSSQWEKQNSDEQPRCDNETYDPPKSRDDAMERGNPSERTVMLPETGCEAFEVGHSEANQRKTSIEVTNLTYLIMGRKQEQQNNNVFHTDLNGETLEESNSSEENSDDVCYLQLRNGNLLTEVQGRDSEPSAVISEVPSLCIEQPAVTSSVPYSESFLINRSPLSSGDYVSGSGTSCLTADTHLSSS